MINKHFKYALFALAFVFIPLSSINAQDVVTEINARLLPAIWFSALEVGEGDDVRVYAAVQNNSGTDFSGEVVFYVDGAELGKSAVSSKSDTLEEVSVPWVAVAGRHAFRARLTPNLPEGTALLSYETPEAELEVKKIVTLEEVKGEAGEIIHTVVGKIDELALGLADKLEAAKKPAASSQVSSEVSGDESDSGEEVLGAATGTKSTTFDTLYNMGLGILGVLVREWMWTLSGAAVLLLIWSFRS